MRFLHTMLRVYDLEKSLHFYKDVLGFQERRRLDHEKGRFTLVFLAPPGAPEGSPELELTYNWGHEPYNRGNAYGHLAFAVDSLEEVEKKLKAHGLGFSWGPGKSPGGGNMAFIDDPDGYEIELLER
ncbi:MAG: VOC family protein [Armatimonadota bacterium]|nr:VOC family protein [Armatimonadota bacterium]